MWLVGLWLWRNLHVSPFKSTRAKAFDFYSFIMQRSVVSESSDY